MINIMISGRRREGQDLDSFYHEFESTHVHLMRQARCDRFIKRYTQNKTIPLVTPIELWAKVDPHFDSQASLAFDDLKVMGEFFSDPDYNQIVKPHQFTDPNYMTFELSEECTIKPGSVTDRAFKVIYYLKPQGKMSRSEFRQLIDGPYSEFALAANKKLLTLHLRSYCFPEDQTRFARPSFEKAKISQYGVIDELWFKDLEDIRLFHLGLKQKVHQKFSDKIDFENSFSLVVTDHLVFGNRP
jgi:hypothetical protein